MILLIFFIESVLGFHTLQGDLKNLCILVKKHLIHDKAMKVFEKEKKSNSKAMKK